MVFLSDALYSVCILCGNNGGSGFRILPVRSFRSAFSRHFNGLRPSVKSPSSNFVSGARRSLSRSIADCSVLSFPTEPCLRDSLFTFNSFIQNCCKTKCLTDAHLIYAHILSHGLEPDVFLGTSLVNMYIQCGCIEAARRVFYKLPNRDALTWNMMILAYAKDDSAEEAINIFDHMQGTGIELNEFTYVGVFTAASNLLYVEKGYEVHSYVVKIGAYINLYMYNALMDLYINCRRFDDACHVFKTMDARDEVSWNTLITGAARFLSGFAENELYEKAQKVFGRLVIDGVKPDLVTFTTVNHACANIAALEQGRVLHFYLTYITVSMDATVVSSVIDLYAKCGSLDDAQYIINTCADKDIISWNTLVSGCSQHGQAIDLPQLVNCMEKNGVRLNELTSLSLLSAYGRSGLVPQGICLFNYLAGNLTASLFVEHTACMVDLLGRAGCLDELMYLVQMMPFQPTATVWGALLGACKLHGLLELAEYASWEIIQLEPQNMAVFVVLSNMYATP